MHEKQVLERAFAMPLTSPAYPHGPYRFVNREYLIITYRTDPAMLRARWCPSRSNSISTKRW
jgi:acetoacetate decarboxylase